MSEKAYVRSRADLAVNRLKTQIRRQTGIRMQSVR